MRLIRLSVRLSLMICGAALALFAFEIPPLLLALFGVAACVLVLLYWRSRRAEPLWVVIDGSNVMHWNDGKPDLKIVREVAAELAEQGFTPGVVFDANVGYKICGRYLNERRLAVLLKLPADCVYVVPKGTPADPFILRVSRGLRAPIVTNDRYRDWMESYPEIGQPGRLIRGRYRQDELILDEVPALRLADAAQ